MERVVSLDVLRGFALLGILLMNVVSFAYPNAAYLNPNAYDVTLLNNVIFSVNYVFFDQKMMGLFSMLFGASIMLFVKVLAAKGRSTFGIYYSRTFWLFFLGLVHGIFIWEGDILIIYAVCGVFLYCCRHWHAMIQFSLGILLFLTPILFQYYAQSIISVLSPSDLLDLAELWQPPLNAVSAEIQLHQSSYLEQLKVVWSEEEPVNESAGVELFYAWFFIDVFARAAGMMLIGMALYSWGVLTNDRTRLFYKRLLIIGFSIGVALASWGLWQNAQHDWHYSYSVMGGRIWNNLATGFTVAGYIGFIMLCVSSSKLLGLTARLQAVGRMALTNYIMHSLLGLFIFSGAGFGFFSYFNRLELLGFVIAVWVMQLFISPWWLRYFRYGPLEWCWRSLTYFKLQPLKAI